MIRHAYPACCHRMLLAVAGHNAPGSTEADLIRYVGVAVAVIGALVAAPDGAAVIGRQASRVGRRIAAYLHLSFLRKNVTVHGLPAKMRFGAPAGRVQVGTEWESAAPDTRKIEILHEQMKELESDIARLGEDMRKRFTALRTVLDEEMFGLRGAQQSLIRQIEAAERRAARVDARGIWPIGFGIVLTGIPGELADIRALGIIVVIIVVAVTAAMIRSVIADVRRKSAARGAEA
jgi:hypothetical protein